MIVQFKCPECGRTEIDEVVVDCIIFNTIEIDSGGSYVNVKSYNKEGQVDRYECAYCGHEIKTDFGESITSTEILAEVLLARVE